MTEIPEIRYGVVKGTGRRVVTCYCGGGDIHEHRPYGGGTRILACPPEPFYPPVFPLPVRACPPREPGSQR